MSENMTQLLEKLVALTAERDHWKANHDNRVRAAKLLTERTDMPMERIGEYKNYVASLEENQRMREWVESVGAELLAVREDNHSMMLEIDGLRTELAKLREQEPIGVAVACNKDSSPGFTVAVFSEADVPAGSSVYASPIPAPDCLACANRGQVNGLSQESYCDGCIYHGLGWRKNHFVDAAAGRLLEGLV